MKNDAKAPFSMRIDNNLRRELEREASEAGISVAEVVTRRLDDSYARFSDINDLHSQSSYQVAWPFLLDHKAVRIICGDSTYRNKDTIIYLINNKFIDNVILGAKYDDLNDFVLVALIKVGNLYLLADNMSINNARRPRKFEVDDITRALLKKDVLVGYFTQPIPDLPSDPELAVAQLLKINKIMMKGVDVDVAGNVNLLLRGKLFS